jgi:cell division inhibitor SepF
MSIVDNLKRWIRPEDEGYDEDEDMTSAWAVRSGRSPRESERKEVSIRTTTQLRVAIVQPRGLEDLPAVADDLKSMMTVVLNVENLDRDLARRVLDVISGVAYGLDAGISRVASNTYMILPYNVEFQGGLVDELKSSGILRRDAEF